MSQRPSLRQLEYFLAAVDNGSFAAAAAALHVAQPSLSEQIARLERMIGAQLFVRTNRNLQLTDVGRQLIPLAQTALRGADTFVEAARDLRTVRGGTVTFGTFSSAHRYLLIPVTSEFTMRYPDVRVRVLGLNSSDVAELVRDGAIEAGLVQLPIDDRGLEIGSDELIDSVVYVSADSRRTVGSVTIQQLAESKLILSEARWGEADPMRRRLAQRAREAGLEIEPFIEVEFQSAAMQLAINGVADTLMSYLVTQQPQYRGLVTWAPLDPIMEERFAIVRRAGGVLSPVTRAFMTIVHRHVAALQSTADTALR